MRVVAELLVRLKAESKHLISLKCIGAEGRSILFSECYIALSISLVPTYETTIEILRKHYGDNESGYVKTQKFVTGRQAAGEDYFSYMYLHGVHTLSRSLDMFDHANADVRANSLEIRSHLVLVLALNGVGDRTLCRE